MPPSVSRRTQNNSPFVLSEAMSKSSIPFPIPLLEASTMIAFVGGPSGQQQITSAVPAIETRAAFRTLRRSAFRRDAFRHGAERSIAPEAAPTTERLRIEAHRNPRRMFAPFAGGRSRPMLFRNVSKSIAAKAAPTTKRQRAAHHRNRAGRNCPFLTQPYRLLPSANSPSGSSTPDPASDRRC